jgi:hypothetical protein
MPEDLEPQLNRCGNLKLTRHEGHCHAAMIERKNNISLQNRAFADLLWYTAGKLHSDEFRLRSDWFLHRIFSNNIVLAFCYVRHVDCLLPPNGLGY